MKNWKVIIDYENKRLTVTIQAKTYPDAYINAGLKYPGCTIISISELRKK